MPRVSFDTKRRDSQVESPAEKPPPPTIEVLFDVARDKHRRAILQYLAGTTEEVVDVADIVAYVCITNIRDTPPLPSEENRESGTLELETLHHYHLPLLDAAGLIKHDVSQQQVTIRSNRWLQNYFIFSPTYREE